MTARRVHESGGTARGGEVSAVRAICARRSRAQVHAHARVHTHPRKRASTRAHPRARIWSKGLRLADREVTRGEVLERHEAAAAGQHAGARGARVARVCSHGKVGPCARLAELRRVRRRPHHGAGGPRAVFAERAERGRPWLQRRHEARAVPETTASGSAASGEGAAWRGHRARGSGGGHLSALTSSSPSCTMRRGSSTAMPSYCSRRSFGSRRAPSTRPRRRCYRSTPPRSTTSGSRAPRCRLRFRGSGRPPRPRRAGRTSACGVRLG